MSMPCQNHWIKKMSATKPGEVPAGTITCSASGYTSISAVKMFGSSGHEIFMIRYKRANAP
jgi:hypothetical protein